MNTAAKIAYDAYCAAVGGKAFNGDTLPEFEATPERIQKAWDEAVKAVLEARFSHDPLSRLLARFKDKEFDRYIRPKVSAFDTAEQPGSWLSGDYIIRDTATEARVDAMAAEALEDATAALGEVVLFKISRLPIDRETNPDGTRVFFFARRQLTPAELAKIQMDHVCVYGDAGTGKTYNAVRLASHFGCHTVQDAAQLQLGWVSNLARQVKTLILSRNPIETPSVINVPIADALLAAGINYQPEKKG